MLEDDVIENLRYSVDYFLADVEAVHQPNIRHIGNYREELIDQMSSVAEDLGIQHFTTHPYSDFCNQPEAICSWDAGYEAMHLEASRTQEFWDSFCQQYESVLCGN